MKFSVDRCKITYTRRNNLSYSYTLMDSKLVGTSQERDLDVTVDSSVEMSVQCAMAAKKARCSAVINRIETVMSFYKLIIFYSLTLNAARARRADATRQRLNGLGVRDIMEMCN